jgi:hypothetical protein
MGMRLLILLATASVCSLPATAQLDRQSTVTAQSQKQARMSKKSAPNSAAWPLQLEMRVPFEPTAFPSGPRFYLMYELHLTNFGNTPVSLSRIEVRDADAVDAQPIVILEAARLEEVLQPLGGKKLSDTKEKAHTR